jgi:hypothetical protein
MSRELLSVTRESTEGSALEKEADLPPVVARMVVEIRSDGTRTIARGALEDLLSGERVAVRTDAASPLLLARELGAALLSTRALAADAVARLVPRAPRELLAGLLRASRGRGNPRP